MNYIEPLAAGLFRATVDDDNLYRAMGNDQVRRGILKNKDDYLLLINNKQNLKNIYTQDKLHRMKQRMINKKLNEERKN